MKILWIVRNLKIFKCGLRLGETLNPTRKVDSACKFAEECRAHEKCLEMSHSAYQLYARHSAMHLTVISNLMTNSKIAYCYPHLGVI